MFFSNNSKYLVLGIFCILGQINYFYMESKILNFSDLSITDLEGNKVLIGTSHFKDIGNQMYLTAKTIEESDLGRLIHRISKVESVSLTKEEAFNMLTAIIELKYFGLPAQMALTDFIKSSFEED